MLDNAFLIVWNDVNPSVEAEYRRWHRVEHMPERLAVPGFSLGRRYTDRESAEARYLTIYEVASPGIFESAAYRERLAAPTAWTSRMSAEMTNFVRRVCRTGASEGMAIGAAAATFRLQLDEAGLDSAAGRLVNAAARMEPLVAAHVGIVDAALTGKRRDEMQTRATAPDFNAVLIVEADSRETLAGKQPSLIELIADTTGVAPVASRIYDLALIYRPARRAPGEAA